MVISKVSQWMTAGNSWHFLATACHSEYLKFLLDNPLLQVFIAVLFFLLSFARAVHLFTYDGLDPSLVQLRMPRFSRSILLNVFFLTKDCLIRSNNLPTSATKTCRKRLRSRCVWVKRSIQFLPSICQSHYITLHSVPMWLSRWSSDEHVARW